LPEVPSSDGEDVRLGFELQTGLPWSGKVYQPDFSSISLTHEVAPEVLTVMFEGATLLVVPDATLLKVVAVFVPVAGAETSTEREAVS